MMLKLREWMCGYRGLVKADPLAGAPAPHWWILPAATAFCFLATVGGSAIPADAALSYVGLGDSIAAGFGVGPGQGYVEVYGAELAVDLGVPVNVTNLGVPGTTSANLLNSLTSNAAVRTAVAGADIITYDIGGNDLLVTMGQCAANDAVCMQAFLASVASNLSAILTEIRSLNPEAVVLTMDYQCIANAGIDCVVGSTDGYSPFFYGLNATIHSVAAAGGVPVAAVFAAFDGPEGTTNPFGSGYLGPDGVHPNAAGYSVIAGAFHLLGPTHCGDGQLQPGEGCDDQNRTSGDGCSATCTVEPGWTCSGQPSVCTVETNPCVPATGAKLSVTKVIPPPGDDGLNFTGAFTLTPPVLPQLDPVANGFEVRFMDNGTVVLDVELPAGFDPATTTGWIPNRTRRKWRFVTTTPAATGGIFKAVLTDKSPRKPGVVTFLVKGKVGNYATSTAVEADLVLPGSGQCFAATWPQTSPATPSCRLVQTTLKCK
jgi:cysteine-rich repeat protein